jgi:hypothetical protein
MIFHSPREHLSSNSLNDSHYVACIKWLLLIIDLFLLHEQQALTFDLNIVVLLLGGTLAQAATSANATLALSTLRLRRCVVDGNVASAAGIGVVFPFLLLFLLAFLAPDLVDIEELDRDQVALKSTVPVFATTNEDVSI